MIRIFLLFAFFINISSTSFANSTDKTSFKTLGEKYHEVAKYLEGRKGFNCEYHETDEWSLCSFHGGMCKYGKPHYVCRKEIKPSSWQEFFGVKRIVKKVTLKKDYVLKRGRPYRVNDHIKTIKIHKKFNYKDHKGDFNNASEAITAVYPIGSDSNDLEQELKKQKFSCRNINKKDQRPSTHCIRDIRTAGNLFMPWIRIGVSIYQDKAGNKIENITTSSEYTGL